jgi:hypothetical protein
MSFKKAEYVNGSSPESLLHQNRFLRLYFRKYIFRRFVGTPLMQFRSGDSQRVLRDATQFSHASGQGGQHTASALFAKLQAQLNNCTLQVSSST